MCDNPDASDTELPLELPQGTELYAILQDVEHALADIADMEISITNPEDLERVRRSLPTEPFRAEIVSTALPPPLRGALEYVHPSERQDGYWRRSRDRSTPSALTDAELKQRLAFIEAARATRGKDGVVRTDDGRVISQSAEEIGSTLAGDEFRESPVGCNGHRGRDLLERILDRI